MFFKELNKKKKYALTYGINSDKTTTQQKKPLSPS